MPPHLCCFQKVRYGKSIYMYDPRGVSTQTNSSRCNFFLGSCRKCLCIVICICIVITMPNRTVYINRENDEQLSEWSKSPTNLVGSLINKLLSQFFSTEKKSPVASPHITTQSTPLSDNGFLDAIEAMPHYKTDPVPNPNSGELSCCTRTKTCKHWAWQDSGIYINSLSGREREADI